MTPEARNAITANGSSSSDGENRRRAAGDTTNDRLEIRVREALLGRVIGGYGEQRRLRLPDCIDFRRGEQRQP